MILWQAQRVGSTWVEGLLNSHPEIEMQSEIYNYCPDAACLQRMCGLFTKPQHAADRVRGFKQKFFYCGGGLQKNWKVCLPADAGLNALERCLLPNDPEVSTRDNIKTIIRRHQHSLSHQMFTHVGAKIVCMLRRNAFDIALSMRTHNILSQRCSISNLVDAEAFACWEEVRALSPHLGLPRHPVLDAGWAFSRQVRRGGVWINATEFGKTVAAQTRFTRFQVEVCEAQARLSPVYFLW